MKRVYKNLLVFALIAVISLSSFAFVSAEGNVNSSIIYFEAPDFWGDFDDVFCHIRPYGGEAFANWHSEVTKCTKVSDGVYAYDISKVCTIDKYSCFYLLSTCQRIRLLCSAVYLRGRKPHHSC